MTTETQNHTKKVWEIVRKAVTGVSVQDLCRQLALTFEEVMTAVRWLARDHNIGLAHQSGTLLVIA